jgi:medium-chain acyl-[acyl-carrier-protein] hydrolase
MFISEDRWIHIPEPNKQATARFFCLPYSGGDAFFFYTWQRYLPPSVELCLLQLPGRENGPDERFLADFPTLITGFADAIQDYLDLPYVLFGYSNGSIQAFELASQICARRQRAPDLIIPCVCPAPHLFQSSLTYKVFVQTLGLSEDGFVDQLRGIGVDLNKTPGLSTPEAQARAYSYLQKDRPAFFSYNYQPGEPLPCPILVLAGEVDPLVTQDELSAWQVHTSGTFSIKRYQGGHTIMYTDRERFLATLWEELQKISLQGSGHEQR